MMRRVCASTRPRMIWRLIMIDYDDTMPYFSRDDWAFILRALEWDEETAMYYGDDDYDYAMKDKIHAKIRGLIGVDND